jgi:ParB/RepB/Spo0J family partition protein
MISPQFNVLDLKVIEVPIIGVSPDERQPRGEIDREYIKQLAASIKAIGQTDPIAVWTNGVEYFIKHGECRYLAMLSLGMETIRVIVYPENASEISFEAMVANNTYRKSLNDLDLALAVVRIVSERLGISHAQVKTIFGRIRKNRMLESHELDAVNAACNAVRLRSHTIARLYMPLLRLPQQLNWLIRLDYFSLQSARRFALVRNLEFQERLSQVLQFELPLTKGKADDVVVVLSAMLLEAESLIANEEQPDTIQKPAILVRLKEVNKKLRQKAAKLSPDHSAKILTLFDQIDELSG